MGTQGEANGKTNHPDEREPFFSAFEGTSVERPGTQIGRFKLLSVLGEGGYGVVYLAEQERPMRRRAALKIIKPGMDSKEVLSRFESERQALALLDHAHIAHVFTSGATDAGRPYFVMEYVDGLPITEYCDQHQLSIEDRLRLFQQVCSAVQHAHQKGIIHRDLKPSNILVSTQNDLPVAKIIDFGVARAISQPLTDRTLYTERGQMVGTPEYMSPEQADMAFEGIDTRSDVYSLGAVLYELLTGTLPFDAETLRQGGAEGMRKTLREQDPFTPSTRLSSLGDDAKTIAGKRNTEVSALTKQLQRELEWIPLKALRKDRTRRYQAADELARDIQNYLNGDVLIAGPESIGYRAKKFVQRHAGFLGMALLVLAIVLMSFIVITQMYFSSQQQAEDYRRALYVSQIALAEDALKAGDSYRVTEILPQCPNDLRGWEWDWLRFASDTSVKTWQDGDYNHDQLALSPDGTQFVTSSAGKILLWDFGSDHSLKTINTNKEGLKELAYSPDGRQIVSVGDGYEYDIDLWDIGTGEQTKCLKGHSCVVGCVAFCPTGRFLVSGSLSGDDRIRLWNIETGGIVWSKDSSGEQVWDIRFSPDGSEIASLSRDKQRIRIWETYTGEQLRVLGNSGGHYRIMYTPDGQRLIAIGKTINIIDSKTGAKQMEIAGDTGEVLSLAISRDGQYLAASQSNGSISLWNAHTGIALGALRGTLLCMSEFDFTPNGRHLISIQGEFIKMWKIPPWSNPMQLPFHHSSWIFSLAFSPDSTCFASASFDGTVRLWDAATGQQVSLMQGHTSGVGHVCFSPDGKFIASASDDKTVRLWNSKTGEPHLVLKGPQGQVRSLDWSPKGDLIASCGTDCKIRLWDAHTGKESKVLVGHLKTVFGVVFIDEGRKLVSMSQDGTVIVWDTHLGKVIKTLQGPQEGLKEVWFIRKPLAVSRDGRSLAVVKENFSIDVWDTQNWKRIAILRGHGTQILYCTFTPDGRRLVLSTTEGVQCWDIEGQKEVSSLRAIDISGGWTHAIAISPNARYLAFSHGGSGTLFLADAGPEIKK